MAVQLVDNFDLSSKKPLDSRAYWDTLVALQANRTVLMPDGFLAYVKDKKCYYIMNCTNPADPSTYKWTEFKTGASSGSGSTTGPSYTAGDNIQIDSDNKISATDTKYTLTADKDNPMKIDLTNAAEATDKQSVEIPIHFTGVEGYPTPVGTVITFTGKTAPQNYLACDGKTYNITDYPELSAFIKAQKGKTNFYGGDGTTTFAVPTLSGDNLYCIKYKSDDVILNVYSTDETIIGRWIDGKPIYRKVIQKPTNGMDVSSLNIETPIKMEACIHDAGNMYFIKSEPEPGETRFCYLQNNTLQVTEGSLYAVLEYTKTTDDATTLPAGSHPSTYSEYSTVATDEEVNLALA